MFAHSLEEKELERTISSGDRELMIRDLSSGAEKASAGYPSGQFGQKFCAMRKGSSLDKPGQTSPGQRFVSHVRHGEKLSLGLQGPQQLANVGRIPVMNQRDFKNSGQHLEGLSGENMVSRDETELAAHNFLIAHGERQKESLHHITRESNGRGAWLAKAGSKIEYINGGYAHEKPKRGDAPSTYPLKRDSFLEKPALGQASAQSIASVPGHKSVATVYNISEAPSMQVWSHQAEAELNLFAGSF